jgi:ferritin
MKNEKMHAALNRQINAELHSAYLYLSMAAYFEAHNFKGFANWMKVQAQEEMVHAMKFYDFVLARRWEVVLTKIEAPTTTWKSPLAVFQNALEHEQKVTALINGLVVLAVESKDYAASSFLQWFVDEQVEEEANADEIVSKLALVGENNAALFMFDAELAKRTFAKG